MKEADNTNRDNRIEIPDNRETSKQELDMTAGCRGKHGKQKPQPDRSAAITGDHRDA